MKPPTRTVLRFLASLFAYVLFFATGFCPWNDLLQKLVTGSLVTIVVVLMAGALVRGSGILVRGFAFVLLIPAVWYLSILVYRLSPVGSDRSKAETEELLRASSSVFRFGGAQSETRRLLRRSSSLRYTGCARYLDGGSMGFVFSNQEAKAFVVFVPNPNLAEGIGLEDGRKFQRILLVANGEFTPDEPLELRMGSRAEAKVMWLVRSTLQENLPADRREEVFLLLEILAERTFDWETFQKRDFGSGLPRAKGRNNP
jgi:hypothetical protein